MALLAAALLPASPGLAQTQGSASVDLSLPTLAAPVSPSDVKNTSATVRYEWQDGVADENVTVELSYENGPAWLESSFSPSTVEFDLGNNPSGVQTRIVDVSLDVSENATAYTEAQATYRAEASEAGTLPSAETEESLDLVAGFDGRLVAELPRGNVTAWGGLLQQIPIDLENTANGPLEVEVRVDRKPADARATAPETVELGHEEGNRSTQAHLDVRVPWSLSLEGPIELVLEPQHATRGTELAERRVGFHLEGKSAVPVPGPGPWASLAAVGLALLIRRGSLQPAQ